MTARSPFFKELAKLPGYVPQPKRTLQQVTAALAKCEKTGGADAAQTMARLMDNHGNIDIEARQYVREYLASGAK